MTPSRDIERLIEIMAALRDRQTGCPWDIEQTFATIAPYTIEEAYEVADAIARGDMRDLCEELGDLLLQVVYHAQMASEAGTFAFPDVVEAITTKLIRRHPHVFGDADAKAAGAAKGQWERIKAEEKRERGIEHKSALDGVPLALPALMRALKLQEKASRVGFDWNNPRTVLAKVREETAEIEAELERTPAIDRSAGGRDRRPSVCRRQPCPPCEGRSRTGAAANERQGHATLCQHRNGARGRWTEA